MSKFNLKRSLLATTVIAGMAAAAPAYAQDAQTPPPPAPATGSTPAVRNDQSTNPAVAPTTNSTANQVTNTGTNTTPQGEIVITGSILRRTTTETPSPVTVISAESLEQRGILTTQSAIQSLASNNGPALSNSFTANGAFAAGASAVSLRGLSTNSTLVLFDGMRAAYYPLADDGSRNFVDLNTIPDDIVERVEVLRDGASSTYGADAIAGVVNIITKREFKGLTARADYGISQHGKAPEYRASVTAGTGDLADQGFNAYISGFYYRADQVKNSDLPNPYNTADLRGLCYQDSCGANGIVGGLNSNGVYTGGTPTSSSFIFRPYDPTNTTAQSTRYQNLSEQSCPTNLYTLTAADLAANPTAPTSICQVDYTNQYQVVSPNVRRFGLSGRVTVDLGGSTEAYAEVNFLQSKVQYSGFPASIYGTAPTGIFYPQFSTSSSAGRAAGSGIIALPIYVCPRGSGQSAVLVHGVATVPGCTAANGTLNPNNPFAAAGEVSRIFGRDLDNVTNNETRNRAYRAALGIKGNITDGINFTVGATAMHEDLRSTQDGYVYIQHLLDVIADGSYNFINPSLNSQATNDYLTPANVTDATSDQFQLEGNASTALVDLPGGPLQLGVGASIRYEAVDAPSQNSDINGPTQRYFTLNAFGTTGHRTIKSVFGELDAPITHWASVNASGRYDSYSSGQSAFSPKIGFKFTPVREIALRGTYSRGFRIPSFGEANALPTTGYVTNSSGLFTDAFLAQYGCNTHATSTSNPNGFSTCPTYINAASYGLTTLASPNLKPEKSRSITLGVIVEPIRNVSFTVDFYDIKKTGAITAPDTGTAIKNFYAGLPVDPSIAIITNAPDVNFPNASPTIAFVQAQLINANTITTSGLDFGANIRRNFGAVKWSSALDASYIIKLNTELPDGSVQQYAGTLGNFNLTAGSGTPRWRATWQNTFDYGPVALTGTVNYFGGYNLSAEDQTGPGTAGECGLNGGNQACDVKSYTTLDLNLQVKLLDKFTLYGTMLNVFNKLPPLDTVTYGAYLYNPVQGGDYGIYGRYFKMGLKAEFGGGEHYVAPPAPMMPPPPATITCPDGSVISADAVCAVPMAPPAPPPPPPPPAPAPSGERGL